MRRWIGAVQCSECNADSVAEQAQAQYIGRHSEQALLAFVVHETKQCLYKLSQRNQEAESDKFGKRPVLAPCLLFECKRSLIHIIPLRGPKLHAKRRVNRGVRGWELKRRSSEKD